MALKGYCLFFVWLSFTCLQAEEIVWKKQASDFEVEVRISQKTLPVDQPLTVTVSLSYPDDYEPDIATLRYNLLKNNTFMAAPFIFTKDKVVTAGNNQTITFTLDPQVPGNYPLTFYQFSFLSPTKESVSIPSEIFTVEFTPSTQTQAFALIPAPLMSLDNLMPVDIKPELQQAPKSNPNKIVEFFDNKSFPLKYIVGAIAAIVIAWFFRRKQKDRLV